MSGLNLRSWEYPVGTYKPYPTRFPLYLNKFVLIHTRIRWASGLHGNSPLMRCHVFMCALWSISFLSWLQGASYICMWHVNTCKEMPPITLFKSITMLCGTDNIMHYIPTFGLYVEIFHIILSVPHNIVMDITLCHAMRGGGELTAQFEKQPVEVHEDFMTRGGGSLAKF